MPARHIFLFFVLVTVGIGISVIVHRSVSISTTSTVADSALTSSTPVYGYKIINTYPHDRSAFTQGLAYDQTCKCLYESTGLFGKSSVRKVELKTARVLKERKLAKKYFGEGLTLAGEKNNRLIQLTRRNGVAFIYNRKKLIKTGSFRYPTEGWGITRNSKHLIMSDGTSNLYFLNPKTFERVKQIKVRDGDKPISKLNELEYVKGEIYANLWFGSKAPTNYIARISPQTGRVNSWINLSGLDSGVHPADLPPSQRDSITRDDILNGIAYDTKKDRLFVTGKYWAYLYEIKLLRPEG